MTSRSELALLNFLRASELHSGLMLGHMARRTTDPALMLSLTRHSAEEVTHARLWTEMIVAMGGKPDAVDTYHTRSAEIAGQPRTLGEVLSLTHVFERRLYRELTLYLKTPSLPPRVGATIRRILEDEPGHLSWVKAWLEGQSIGPESEARELLRKYALADGQIQKTLWSHCQTGNPINFVADPEAEARCSFSRRSWRSAAPAIPRS